MKTLIVAACVLCSIAPAFAFSTGSLPWMKPLSIQQNQGCNSLSRRGPRQMVKGPTPALSMSLDAHLLKSGIAAYGVIIGAGGIAAGTAVFRYCYCSVSGYPCRQRLFPLPTVRYQSRQQAFDNFFDAGEHLARNCV